MFFFPFNTSYITHLLQGIKNMHQALSPDGPGVTLVSSLLFIFRVGHFDLIDENSILDRATVCCACIITFGNLIIFSFRSYFTT